MWGYEEYTLDDSGNTYLEYHVLYSAFSKLQENFAEMDAKNSAYKAKKTIFSLVAFTGVLAGLGLGVGLHTGFLWLALTSYLWLLRDKPWQYIGKLVYGCIKCMPTFWFGIPIFLISFFLLLSTGDPNYLHLNAVAFVGVPAISYLNILIDKLNEKIY